MCALAYSKAWNYTFHQDSSHHIAMPKMGISPHEGTRKATSMVRRGNLFLFLSPFLSFIRWRLKIQHANFVAKQKYGKRICKMKIWLQKGREVPLCQPRNLANEFEWIQNNPFPLLQHLITKIPIPSMPTFKQYLMAIQLQSPLKLYIPLTSSTRI